MKEYTSIVDDKGDIEYTSIFPKAPRRIVLHHNRVRHRARSTSGWNGFRFWYSSKPLKGFTICPCGWAPKAGKHYAWAEYVKAIRPKRKSGHKGRHANRRDA